MGLVDELVRLSGVLSRLALLPFRRLEERLERLYERDVAVSIVRRVDGIGASGMRAIRRALERLEQARERRRRRRAFDELLRLVYGDNAGAVKRAIEAGVVTEDEVVEEIRRALRRATRRGKRGKRRRRHS